MTTLSLQALNRIFDDLQKEAAGLRNITNDLDRRQAFIDLRENILSARQSAHESHTALLQEIDELKGQLMSFKDWETQAQQYQPQQFDPGVTVYVLKPAMATGQPDNQFCPHCYANRKIRILQPTAETSQRRRVRVCLECKSKLAYGQQAAMPPPVRVITEYDPLDRI